MVKPQKHAGGPRQIENSRGSQDGYPNNGTNKTQIPTIDIIAHRRRVFKPKNPYLRSTASNQSGVTNRVQGNSTTLGFDGLKGDKKWGKNFQTRVWQYI